MINLLPVSEELINLSIFLNINCLIIYRIFRLQLKLILPSRRFLLQLENLTFSQIDYFKLFFLK
ncbi:hypothetical protein A1OE_185 [Candidatus Endolissoclinum faulkneri L2]|uniref:Uncharacterized protein n=1 Tax=Candidatus Endolissoclinum faulkneri L2 TaxID=1193729 RepID=K7YLM1_9PROT|nr:hypothetical protein A1OE_185 [Candidatus Endolissoclinum faulkneri L2]